MKFLTETFQTPLCEDYDIIVVGAGPAGCGAAIAAGRTGAKVLLIEKQNCLGGMWTAGMVNPLFDQENKKKGIIRELVNALNEQGVWGGFRDICFNYEHMKVLLEKLTKEANVTVLYNTQYVKVLKEENRVCGVVVENISGRCAYRAKGVIDCSADGAVCCDAGAQFEVGDKKGECQAMTLMFLVSNVPEKRLNTDFMMYKELNRVYELEGKKIPFTAPVLITIPNSTFAVIQFTHMYHYNPLDAKDITEATMEGRRQMFEAITMLKKHDPEFAKLDLVYSAPILGVRESRRIVGEYQLTLDDLLKGSHFEDGITEVQFNVDIHNANSADQKLVNVEEYQIPFRCLIPKGLDGILVAGRCISGTHEAQASYRVTADCCEMGEAAGYGMAFAIQNNMNIRDIDIQKARAPYRK